MRKTILLAVIACILGIVLLIALAFFIPGGLGQTDGEKQSELFTGFLLSTEKARTAADSGNDSASASSAHTSGNETLPDGMQSEAVREGLIQTEPVSESVRHFAELPSRVTEHQIIWVGDSRTLGLGNALHKEERPDDDLFVGRVGEGVRWFREEGIAEMSDAIAEHPGVPVVLNFGVNDPQLVDEYVVAYWDVIRAHPDTQFYILSVNPLDEEFLIEDGQVNESVFDDINSLNVARMNVKLKEEFGSRYIDSASYLKAEGFETVDGLHFSTRTYLNIHDYVVSLLF